MPAKLSDFQLDKRERLQPQLEVGGTIGAGFTFDIPACRGWGYFRLLQDEAGQWTAITVYVMLDALKVGAGQNGLMMAARFTQMNISTLVMKRVGDKWRERYPTMSLHSINSHHTSPSFSIPATLAELWVKSAVPTLPKDMADVYAAR
ncbi:hypothetical protein WOLCODRAFT_146986 [Wolfiporia cocos MD-104 SS10]|uniref:Uncharacterized protein n=1 Tax=Wolfiporia cocos (strain MD-104) TaxID=742152 RepID=A0A2H3JBN7_WOLCO|nr:hypothetical protein WOLCODRAFT_146986 [Wolfiporia cocos MD-104 SS10]